MKLEEIVERCKKGEQQAQSYLYKRYSRQMLRICYRLVADRQIAQDLMHDGFILIFTSIHTLQKPEKIEIWMGRIMTNLALRYINQTRSTSITSLSDLPEDQQPVNEEPMPDILPLETLLMIVERLPEGYRNVFKLSVFDGLSHKEIAELLHIAPHSSSSQFYRAKEYLKKMIIQYNSLLILILLLIPISYWLFWRSDLKTHSLQPIMVIKELDSRTNIVELDSVLPIHRRKYITREAIVEDVPLIPDTVIVHPERISTDTVKTSVVIRKPKSTKQMEDHNRECSMFLSTVRRSGWALAFEYKGGRNSTNLFPKHFRTPVDGDISSSPIPPYTDNWNDYYRYLQQYGQHLEDQREVQSLKTIAQQNSGMIEEKQHHYLPFTLGILLHKSLDRHWGIETGVNYTCLVSDFKTGNNAFITERQKLHYIGIPLRGTYLWGRFNHFSIYSSIGITMEIPIFTTLKTEYVVDGKIDYSKRDFLKTPLQWSISGGLGVQYQLTPSVGIFAEPNLHYYFNDRSGLKTIRKEHPFGASLPIGIRFSY